MRRELQCVGCAALILLGLPHGLQAQNPVVAEAEAQRCEERIASVQREVLNRYESSLAELQANFQKAADLEGALAIRAERQRVSTEGTLTEKAFATEPKALRALQAQTVAKIQELTAQLVAETLPKLVELKRQLTIAGKLDDAVAVRASIERLQNGHVPMSAPETGGIVAADTLLLSYSADRARADKAYKGKRITVRGVIGGFRQDPADAKSYLVYFSGTAGGWVQCAFSTNDHRIREDKQLNNVALVVSPKNDEAAAVRFQKGQTAEIRGICDGFEEFVRLTKCELVR